MTDPAPQNAAAPQKPPSAAQRPAVPPIPLQLAHRPTQGGIVLPWVNVQLADGGVDFRVRHNRRWLAAWQETICQLCGRRFQPTEVMICLAGPDRLDRSGFFDEPPLHAVCARYAEQACPMVAGRQSHFASTPPVSHSKRGKKCAQPGCDCGGWIPTPGIEVMRSAGEPAHAWTAFYLREYVLAVDQQRRVLGGIPTQILRRRPVSEPPG